MSDFSYMDKNLAAIKARIDAACERRGYGGVTLLAAIKYTDAAHVNYLHRALGISDVGENRVQQLTERWDALDREGLRMHFIGTLQRNKVKYIIDKVAAIHSVDSAALANEISRRAVSAGLTVNVFAEVNIGREESKSGAMPEEIPALCREIVSLPGLALKGLMTMAPHCDNPADYHAYFREAKKLADEVWQALGLAGEPQLSMGMSESFTVAVTEGASMVRVGRRLFVK